LNDEARAWALSADDDERDVLFDALVRATEAELGGLARNLASRIAGSQHAGEVLNDVWLSLWRSHRYDPARSNFGGFFLRIVRNRAVDHARKHLATPVPTPDEVIEQRAARAFDLAVEELDKSHLEERLRAAIEVLDLTARLRELLEVMLDADQQGSTSAADRKARERLRDVLVERAKLAADEREAARLMRKHHTITGAAIASGVPENDLKDAYARARRKVLALFGLNDGDDQL